MTALITRREHSTQAVARPRRIRIDAPVTYSEVYPDSMYLRRWAARQASGYRSLLLTVAAATRPR